MGTGASEVVAEAVGQKIMTLDRAFTERSPVEGRFMGVVVDVRESSGVVRLCGCGRIMRKGECRVHKTNVHEATEEFRVKCVLDDGTGAVLVIVAGEAAEKFAESTLAEHAAMSKEESHERLDKRILGRSVAFEGKMVSDEFGWLLLAERAEMLAGVA